ncbi:hypothetical protein KC726_01655 [Candidatus Woesebacteria bacterium]|nr:hypothetical protein [Candidatus Woesebacteria bacterium]
MHKHFYTHLLQIDSIIIPLDTMELLPEEKNELLVLIETQVHHVVIDTVLSELSEEHKRIFLANLEEDNHETIWKHLKEQIEEVETKIQQAVHTLQQTLHQDMVMTKLAP